MTTHEFEDLLTRMLKWDIKIGEKMFEILEFREMIEGEDIWIEIVYSICRRVSWIIGRDKIINRLINLLKKLDESCITIEIGSISRCILRDNLDLADSL
jgi:hypothetical protein